jgi:hypothetical protein
MKQFVVGAFLISLIQLACALDITDSNVQDHLLMEKTKAQALVLQVKTDFVPGSPQYVAARQKYTAAEQAFNNYTKAMLSNYKVGRKADLKESAELAAVRAKEFQSYVVSLNLQSKNFAAIFVATGILLDIGEKLFNFVQKFQEGERSRVADIIALQVTWDDWNKIGSGG